MKGIADAALVDEFLIQLADAHSGKIISGILACVGDGAAVDQGQSLTARQGQQPIVEPVPTDAWLKGIEPDRTALALSPAIAPAHQLQHLFECFGRQIAIGISSADQLVESDGFPRFHRRHGDDLLSQNIEAVGGNVNRFDAARGHFSSQHRLFQQIGGRLGNQAALAGAANKVAGATDTLQGPGDAAGRFDLANQVDCSHVDTEFQ